MSAWSRISSSGKCTNVWKVSCFDLKRRRWSNRWIETITHDCSTGRHVAEFVPVRGSKAEAFRVEASSSSDLHYKVQDEMHRRGCR